MQVESNAFEKTLNNVQEDPVLRDKVRSSVIDALKGIFDPEISINIYDLGLIYDFKITADGTLHILSLIHI